MNIRLYFLFCYNQMRYRGVFRWFRDDTIMLGDSDLSVVFASLCYFQNFQFDFSARVFFYSLGKIKQIKNGGKSKHW